MNLESNDLLTALLEDIRFKTMHQVKPKYLLRPRDGHRIESLIELKRDKHVFVTDKYTVSKCYDKLIDLIRNYEQWVRFKTF